MWFLSLVSRSLAEMLGARLRQRRRLLEQAGSALLMPHSGGRGRDGPYGSRLSCRELVDWPTPEARVVPPDLRPRCAWRRPRSRTKRLLQIAVNGPGRPSTPSLRASASFLAATLAATVI